MIKTDLEIAAMLNSEFFKGPESLVKRRVRNFLKKMNISPVEKYEENWLYLESSLHGIRAWDYKSESEKARPTGKSRDRMEGSAFERVQARLARKQRKSSVHKGKPLLIADTQAGEASQTQ